MPFRAKPEHVAWIKAAVFAACLIPLTRLVVLGFGEGLGANPIEYITHSTGWWTLTFLMITLAVTPVRRLFNQPWLLRLRRMFGLYTFFYASLHFITYIWLDQFFDGPEIVKDVIKRPFITFGFAAFVLLIPLAATSTNAMVKRLGARRWQWLHRLVYPVAALAVIHFWWLVKLDLGEPLLFALILAGLLIARLLNLLIEQRRKASALRQSRAA